MMTDIKRGDTFIVTERTYRGIHFTCVGLIEDGFLAGDTTGRMWKFTEAPGIQYQVCRQVDGSWDRKSRVDKESVIAET